MKFLFCVSLAIFAFLSFACSKDSNVKSEEVFIDDGFKTVVKDEIVIEDASYDGAAPANADARARGWREMTQTAPDGSQIMTMYDAFGNKTEKRVFDGDALLQLVAVRTSASGEKQISVFGQNGSVRPLPPAMLDKVLTASAGELATAAGIYEGRRKPVQPTYVQTDQPNLQPMPSYRFPVRQPQTESVAAAPDETQSETVDSEPVQTAKPESGSSSAPKSKDDDQAPKSPTGEQK